MANRIQGAETERPPSLPSDYISTRFDSLSTPRRKTSTSMPIRSIENFKQLLHDYSIRASELAIRHIYSFAFFIGLILALVSCFYISLDVENIVGTVLSVFLLHILLANLLNEAGLSRCHLISFVYIAVFTILWGIVAYVQGHNRQTKSSLGVLAFLFGSKPTHPQSFWTILYNELHSYKYVVIVISVVLVVVRVLIERWASLSLKSKRD